MPPLPDAALTRARAPGGKMPTAIGFFIGLCCLVLLCWLDRRWPGHHWDIPIWSGGLMLFVGLCWSIS